MDIPHILSLLALTLLLVAVNAFFVATEFAIIKVRSTRIRELAEAGNPAARMVAGILERLDEFLSSVQLGVTLCSLGLGWLGEPAVAVPVGMLLKSAGLPNATLTTSLSFIIAFLIITFLEIVFGELVPKWMAIKRAESIALWAAYPMAFFFWIFKPFTMVLNASANGVFHLFGMQRGNNDELVHSEDELRMIISASGSENGGTIRETQAELLDNVFDFGHRMARQVMTHRTDILMLDVVDPLEENVRLAQEGGKTRYPVIQEDTDSVIGFVHVKDLFALYQRETQGDIRTIIRETLLVPETIRVDLLLRQLQRKRQHMAILIDEYGGTSGLVTVSDLLEELVGDLPDEFEEQEEEWIVRIDEHTWTVDGRTPISDMEQVLDRELPCEEACDTVGGYAFYAFGRIPAVGEQIKKEGISLRVLSMDGLRVDRVQIVIMPEG
ncbi:MAG: hemolysin family protein [bacterium]